MVIGLVSAALVILVFLGRRVFAGEAVEERVLPRSGVESHDFVGRGEKTVPAAGAQEEPTGQGQAQPHGARQGPGAG